MKKDDKRAKFIRLAEGRAQSALTAIRKIGNLSNKRSYEYNDSDIKKIIKAIKDATMEMEHKFNSGAMAGQKKFKLS